MVDLLAYLTSPTLLAPLVGVFAGELLSMRLDQKLEADREDADRERAKASIRAELGEIERELATFMQSSGAPAIAFQTGAYESAISSGNFSLLDATLQRQIADVYGTVTRADALQTQLQRRWHEDDTAAVEDRFTDAIDELGMAIDDVRADLQ